MTAATKTITKYRKQMSSFKNSAGLITCAIYLVYTDI
jgi:hypothetical protein